MDVACLSYDHKDLAQTKTQTSDLTCVEMLIIKCCNTGCAILLAFQGLQVYAHIRIRVCVRAGHFCLFHLVGQQRLDLSQLNVLQLIHHCVRLHCKDKHRNTFTKDITTVCAENRSTTHLILYYNNTVTITQNLCFDFMLIKMSCQA